MKKAALLLLVLVPLLLAACGDDGDDDTAATTTPTETTSEPAGGGGGGEAAGGGGGSVVSIEAASGTELAYTAEEVSAKAGDITVEFTNPQSLSHDVAVEGSDGETIGKTDVIADSKATATLKAVKAGDYTFYCTVPGHREAGMEGTLTVK